VEYKILLDKNANLREVEAEEQTKFVISVIEALEVPFEWNSNESFSLLDKIRLRKILGQYNIAVIDDMNGGVKIFLERDKIAEFYKPAYILKEDYAEIDPRKKLYIEARCSFDSIFDGEQPT
jgi:hypothetical protein